MKRRLLLAFGIFGSLIFAVFAVSFSSVMLFPPALGWPHPPPPSLLFIADSRTAAEQAIANGAEVNQKDQYDRTALQRAAAFGLTDVVRVLLSHGADVHAVDDAGNSSLDLAVGELPDPDEGLVSSAYARPKSTLETARLLVQSGADVNVMNAQGATPLFAAVSAPNNLDTVIFLIKSG
jgi:ankyrin repeat protein